MVEGVVDTCRMIPEQGIKALMHDGKEKVLGNGALYKKATSRPNHGQDGACGTPRPGRHKSWPRAPGILEERGADIIIISGASSLN